MGWSRDVSRYGDRPFPGKAFVSGISGVVSLGFRPDQPEPLWDAVFPNQGATAMDAMVAPAANPEDLDPR
ncbi:MAG: hypothetical protein IGR80_01970 [Synechococcales cyanobacterium K44_A2020_017]|nr:hypothetical protein [Synechococcales cyanobacterium K32_A2020_035]MBF2093509.1 hypothetical protein [Synechococcales cyanobacterium K44_A2020_017]